MDDDDAQRGKVTKLMTQVRQNRAEVRAIMLRCQISDARSRFATRRDHGRYARGIGKSSTFGVTGYR